MTWVCGVDFGYEIPSVSPRNEEPLPRAQVEVDFTPHFRAYALEQGRTPEEQLEHDRLEWPGGHMTGFQVWMRRKKAEFLVAHPEAFLGEAIADLALWTRFVTGGERDAADVR